MKKRIISGAVFVALWAAILLINNPLFDTAIVVTLALIATHEYYKAFRNIGYKPISWIGYVGCLALFLMGGIIPEEYKMLLIKIIVPVGLISAFAYMVVGNVKRTILDVAITIFGLLYIPCLFAFLKLILGLREYSRFYLLYVLFGAVVSDTFAFLVGSKFGKTKLAPDISPNKTVEGSMGGIIGVVISFIIMTIVGNLNGIPGDVFYWTMVGVAAAIAGQFGDLTASAIKRFCKIKDFGNIMPGHGGILDRFDSLMFVAPIVYIFITLYV
jgi:phosphatidate cytidylyltransferase